MVDEPILALSNIKHLVFYINYSLCPLNMPGLKFWHSFCQFILTLQAKVNKFMNMLNQEIWIFLSKEIFLKEKCLIEYACQQHSARK